jgi:hypothetical protein
MQIVEPNRESVGVIVSQGMAEPMEIIMGMPFGGNWQEIEYQCRRRFGVTLVLSSRTTYVELLELLGVA